MSWLTAANEESAVSTQRLGRWTSDLAVVGSTPGRGVIRVPRSTQPSICLLYTSDAADE